MAATKHTSLAQETRTHIPTTEAARHLNREVQTLHQWSCGLKEGPLKPIRINGRLAWPVADIKRLLGLEG